MYMLFKFPLTVLAMIHWNQWQQWSKSCLPPLQPALKLTSAGDAQEISAETAIRPEEGIGVFCDTVDGRNPKQPPGMYKNLVNNGINYQPQLVQDFFHQQYFQMLQSFDVRPDLVSYHVHSCSLYNLKNSHENGKQRFEDSYFPHQKSGDFPASQWNRWSWRISPLIMANQPTPPNVPPRRNKALLSPYWGKPMKVPRKLQHTHSAHPRQSPFANYERNSLIARW